MSNSSKFMAEPLSNIWWGPLCGTGDYRSSNKSTAANSLLIYVGRHEKDGTPVKHETFRQSNNCSSATRSLLYKSLSVKSVINAGLADRHTNRDDVWARRLQGKTGCQQQAQDGAPVFVRGSKAQLQQIEVLAGYWFTASATYIGLHPRRRSPMLRFVHVNVKGKCSSYARAQATHITICLLTIRIQS